MAGNDKLKKASKAKNDEFYTRLTDIEKELRHYKNHFNNKTVFCNCDDPFESNFFKYFVLNFNRLGLKKLICTCYTGSPIANTQLSLFDVVETAEENKPYKAVVTTVYDKTGDGGVDMFDIAELFKSGENELTELKGDGDFRSEECIEILKECDIVVTNPPFSLFREYVAQLMKYKKKFVIMGNKNAITYKEFFPLLKNNQIWVGATSLNGGRWMIIPSAINAESKKAKKDINGDTILNIAGVCWFSNLDIRKRHEELILVKRYNNLDYPNYDNYEAINIDKVEDIPYDFDGVMGVPITFMDKYNPEQFEIIELGNSRDNFTPNKTYINPKKHLKDGTETNGGAINCVLAIEYNKKPTNTVYYTSDNSKYLVPPYARILIRNKHPEERK